MMRLDDRLLIFLLVVNGAALWMTVVGPRAFAQGDGEPNRQIEVENGMVSVNLRDVAMSDILRIIGEQAGVKVSIYGKLGNVKAQALTHIPLEEGITKLAETSEVDLIMIYGPGRRLTEVRAYKWPSSPPVAPPLVHIPIPGRPPAPAQHK